MGKKIVTIIALIIFGVILYFCFDYQHAHAFSLASDRITRSWPGATTSHIFTFQTTKNIPPGGKIVIIPEAGDFFIPAGMDYGAVDLATSSSRYGVYSDRLLASTSSATEDGVSIVDNSFSGNISIKLNSNSGIDAGEYVQIEVGQKADFQTSSSLEIINPSTIGAYKLNIYSYDQFDAYLEKAMVAIAVVNPVYSSTHTNKKRSNGSPNGWLTYGTSQTIMSIHTNYEASCRYSTASGTIFDLMTDNFNTAEGFVHSTLISGFVPEGTYDYYVRCRDEATGGVDELTECFYATSSPWKDGNGDPILFLHCVDYWIQFSIMGLEGATGDETGIGGTTGGGGSGGGGGGGLGNDRGRGRGNYLPYPPPPGAPGVILEGYAFPNTDIFILKDGVEQGLALTDAVAEFGAFLEDLVQGVYTFGMWANDSAGRRSITYSTTFWIEEGTQTTVSDIFIPPTIGAINSSPSAGEPIDIRGESVPGARIEVWLLPDKTDVRDNEIIKREAFTAVNGTWSMIFSTSGLAKGFYKLKARAELPDIGFSDFGQIISIAIDESAEAPVCAGADLNGDGRVNITDFSILLFYWNTADACADQNKDGNVDLIDFSIMMFYWTG